MSTIEAAQPQERLPRQIPFIIGNEACERFSFYGMRSILTAFLVESLLLTQVPDEGARKALAKEQFHLFVAGVYFFPLLGGFVADKFFGKYRTILWLSILYVVGHVFLALFENSVNGFYAGLFLIALGSGGIKPCVSSMVGDQFTDKNKHLAKKVFAYFYFSINFGSFFASLLIPQMRKWFGASVAFGLPAVLMAAAVVVFWLGRDHYVRVPPAPGDPDSFIRVIWTGFFGKGDSFWERAEKKHAAEAVEGTRAVFRLLGIFAFIPFFWMLFDQKASTWVIQAKQMDQKVGSLTIEPSQMQSINPALVMILIPLTTEVIYPAFKRWGYELTPLRRIPIGMVIGASSYVVAGLIDRPVAAGQSISILWQLAPYLLLTVAEILVSTTGLEFAYSQAPRKMKGTIMAFWSLTNTIANIGVSQFTPLNERHKWVVGSDQFFVYAGLALIAGIGLALYARSYKVVDFYQKA